MPYSSFMALGPWKFMVELLRDAQRKSNLESKLIMFVLAVDFY